MKTAICYLSCHHGNTRKVVEAMAEAGGADLIDVRTRQMVRLEEYDRVGFASGIYGFETHRALIAFAGSICPRANRYFSSTPMAAQRAKARKRCARSPGKRAARCWGSFPAKATTPLVPSSWWVALPRDGPMRRIWKRRGRFTGGWHHGKAFWKGAKRI